MTDPFPYDGPLRRVDGVAPYNHYLWPLQQDWHWANKEVNERLDSRWNFSVVSLADGRWLANGFVSEDETRMRFFPTREAALRHSAADLVRTLRNARRWGRPYGVSQDDYALIIAWIFQTLNRPAPKLLPIVLPAKPPAWGDLPLFRKEGQ